MINDGAPVVVAIADGSLLSEAVIRLLQRESRWVIRVAAADQAHPGPADAVVVVTHSTRLPRLPGALVDASMVVVVPDDDPQWAPLTERPGIAALVSGTDSPEHLLRTLARVLAARGVAPRRLQLATNSLTAREQAVVELLERGLSDRRVAAHLGLSETTVRSHVRAACRKLGERTRSAMLDAYRTRRLGAQAAYERPELAGGRTIRVGLIAPASIRRNALCERIEQLFVFGEFVLVDPNDAASCTAVEALDIAVIDGTSPPAVLLAQARHDDEPDFRYVVIAADDASPLDSYLAGAAAHVPLGSIEAIGDVLARVSLGDCVIPEVIQRRLVTELRAARAVERSVAGALTSLSPRELAVLRLVSAGRSDDEIAAELGISSATVRSHLQRAGRKSGRRTRRELGVLGSAVAASTLGDA